MMPYILVVMTFAVAPERGVNYYNPTVVMEKFGDQKSCEAAKATVLQMASDLAKRMGAACVPYEVRN